LPAGLRFLSCTPAMLPHVKELLSDFLARGLLSDLLTIGGFLLALLLVARLMSQKKAPANTFAWLLVIILLPYVGVPLYLMFGGRKLRRLAARKARLTPRLANSSDSASPFATRPVAHTIMSSGAGAPIAADHGRGHLRGTGATDSRRPPYDPYQHLHPRA
jgi:cardiolipin synthase